MHSALSEKMDGSSHVVIYIERYSFYGLITEMSCKQLVYFISLPAI